MELGGFRKIRIKKRHKGLAEVRSYLFDKIKTSGMGIIFEYAPDDEVIDEMIIPHDELVSGFVTARGIKSKVNANQVFDLISFKWESKTDRGHRLNGMKQLSIFDIVPECKP